jgi:hypothetical protein
MSTAVASSRIELDRPELERRIKGRVLKQIPIHLSVAVSPDVRNSMTIEEIAPQVGDMFVYQLSAMAEGTEVEVSRVELPASGWDWLKVTLCKILPAWVADRVTIGVIEIPTKVSYHFAAAKQAVH